MCGRNEFLSCESVKKSILLEKMIRQNRKLVRTFESQLALQQTTLLRIVNVRQVQVQLDCRTRKEREGFTPLSDTTGFATVNKRYPNGIRRPVPLSLLSLYPRQGVRSSIEVWIQTRQSFN